MRHTKFLGIRSTGSESFEGFLPYMGVVAILIMLPAYHVNKFSFPYTQKLTYKIWLKLPSCF